MQYVFIMIIGFILGDAIGVDGIINIWNKIVALFV